MQEKRNDATYNRPYGDRPIDAPVVNIDLHAFSKQIKSEDAWRKNDRNAITVFKTTNMHIVLIAMHKDAQLLPQRSESVVCVQVLEGNITFVTDGAKNEVKAGHLITVHEDITYNIIAEEESIFLLTMSGFVGK